MGWMCKAGDHMNGWLMGQSGLQVDDWIGSMPCREGAGAWPAVPHLRSSRSSRSTLSIGGMASTVLPATLMGGDDGGHPWRVDAGCSTVQDMYKRTTGRPRGAATVSLHSASCPWLLTAEVNGRPAAGLHQAHPRLPPLHFRAQQALFTPQRKLALLVRRIRRPAGQFAHSSPISCSPRPATSQDTIVHSTRVPFVLLRERDA
ncbi:hypothetical protein GQ55_2G030400 [Panicum hallii var. hallii]|uniref:Uncharacterized protein n=1 Tax=Panicum hallii var. hallii TaxID=1504633 RepID=A0A2T7EKU8_9POAL|nr:hypothetical protein GQ55_2G030400 [Panicum hallii var. hallii]